MGMKRPIEVGRRIATNAGGRRGDLNHPKGVMRRAREGPSVVRGRAPRVARRPARGSTAPLRLFRNRTSNLGLVTQNVQRLVMQGSLFVISLFLQEIRGFSAIETGLTLTASTVGLLLASALAGRMARRRPQRLLIWSGFVITVGGLGLLLLFARADSNILGWLPTLFVRGVGVGIMLTASVNVVQSSFPEEDQGEISGLSRSVSNLGSSLGTAIAGSVLVFSLVKGNTHFLVAIAVMTAFALIGPRRGVAPATQWRPVERTRPATLLDPRRGLLEQDLLLLPAELLIAERTSFPQLEELPQLPQLRRPGR